MAVVIGCDGLYDVLDEQLIAELCCPWMADGVHDVFNDAVFSREDKEEEEDEEYERAEKEKEEERRRRMEMEDECGEGESDGEGDDDEFKDDAFGAAPEEKKRRRDRKAVPRYVKLISSSYGCKCAKISKGKLAELAATRLRAAADALDTTDNLSVIVLFL